MDLGNVHLVLEIPPWHQHVSSSLVKGDQVPKDPRVQGSKVTRVQGSMAQAAKLSMHPSSWISKIGMHANTFLIESFKLWSIASGAVRCSCFPFCSTCLVQSSRASFICFVRSFCTDVLKKLCEADRIGAVAYVGVFGAKYQQSTIGFRSTVSPELCCHCRSGTAYQKSR